MKLWKNNLQSYNNSLLFTCCAVALMEVACSGYEDGSELPIGSESAAVHQVCAAGSTVFGVDVSYYQGTVNWSSAKAAGVQFAFVRVSDGLNYRDNQFANNWKGTKSAGIIRGAYQFFRPTQDAQAQADYLISQINNNGGLTNDDLPPVIDVEVMDGASSSTVVAQMKIWIDAISKAFNRRPIIYTGSYFWDDNVGSSAYSSYPLWGPNYTSAACPLISSSWSSWVFWQYSDSGSVSGISGGVDSNRFNGTLTQLKSFISSTFITPPAPTRPLINLDSVVNSIANQDRDFCKLNGSSGIFDMKEKQEAVAYILIKNTGNAVAANTTVGINVTDPYLKVTNWSIETDWQHAGTFTLNDSDGMQTVSRTSPGSSFKLNLYALSVGETKRIVLKLMANKLTATKSSLHASLKTYLVHIDNFYEKSSYDATPNNVGKYQTQNSGDVKANYNLDIMGDELCDGFDNNCDGVVDEGCGGTTNPGEGSGSGTGSGSGDSNNSEGEDSTGNGPSDNLSDNGGSSSSNGLTSDQSSEQNYSDGCSFAAGGAEANLSQFIFALLMIGLWQLSKKNQTTKHQ